MLSENIKKLRKEKGLSQDELAEKLNIVRQTVSKWENGLSVPDSEMLILIARELDTTVSVLLDEAVKSDEASELKLLSEKLDAINKQITVQNAARRKNRLIAFIISFTVSFFILICGFIRYVLFFNPFTESASIAIIGGADGPTEITVSDKIYNLPFLIIMLILAVIFALGIYKNRNSK